MKAEVVMADEEQPPVKGWHFYGGGKWQPDPTFECSREVSPACSEVVVELDGNAKVKKGHLAGSYKPVEGKMN